MFPQKKADFLSFSVGRGNMTTAKKNVKNFFSLGEHNKGGIWQRVLR